MSTQKKRKISRPKRRKGKPRKRNLHQGIRHILSQILGALLILGLAYIIYIYIVSPFTLRWKALYGMTEFPEGYSIRGIDISHHQGDINWDKLSQATMGKEPISFIFIKGTEGTSLLDENFNDNFYQAREHGFLRGVYHFFLPDKSAKEQAEFFLHQVHLEEGDLPPVLDIEIDGGLSDEQLREAALTWLKIVGDHYGVKPIIYANYKFKLRYLNTKEFEGYPYWIAHYYVLNLSYKGKWRFWQHTDCGRLEGISGKVDFNIYNGSMYDLRHLTIDCIDQGHTH